MVVPAALEYQLDGCTHMTVMIVSNDNVNAIALPYVWQLTDNYGYTHYYFQTNTLSQMVAIHLWPDFDDLSRGHEANLSENEASITRGQGRGRGQILWGRGQKIGLEAVLIGLEDLYIHPWIV